MEVFDSKALADTFKSVNFSDADSGKTYTLEPTGPRNPVIPRPFGGGQVKPPKTERLWHWQVGDTQPKPGSVRTGNEDDAGSRGGRLTALKGRSLVSPKACPLSTKEPKKEVAGISPRRSVSVEPGAPG